jgi:curli biogenesis system outer membrane secretion channel CsgG
MKKVIVAGWILGVALSILAAPSYGADEAKPRVGVLRFTNHTHAGWWSASVGSELADMLASELSSTGAFEVLERREIDAVLGEQDLGASGRISPATRAKIGKIKGAQYLVAGTVSAYEERVSGGGGGVSYRGVSLGGKKDKTYIAVDLKVIDTETGAIADTRTIEAESKGSGLGAGLSVKGFHVNGGGYEKTPAGKAIRACIIYCSEYLSCSLVEGKDASCMQKWNQMDQRRKKRTKGSIDID